ncbi:MAG: glycosyltransferase [Rhodospirillaceae bacterium]|nr:glycosyltransferase [Rhodospirillaceae bacterium]
MAEQALPAPEEGRAPSWRKRRILDQAEALAAKRDRWIRRNRYFFAEDHRYMRFLVPKGKRVLDLGSGTGDLLARLEPSEGVGVDFSPAMVARAREKYPQLRFVAADVERLGQSATPAGPFDAVVMSDTIGSLDDCLETLRGLHRFCRPETRLFIAYYSRAWEPLFRLGGALRLKQASLPQNWLSTRDITNLLQLADFEVIKREWRILVPYRLLGLGRLINRYVATLPLLRKLCLRNYIVARPRRRAAAEPLSATIVIPCRNERGNVEAAVRRLPRFGRAQEIIFVEGGSSDGTWEEIQRVIAAYPGLDIKAIKQTGKGKGDAVRAGFAAATGDILMILDADLTMPPEDLPKYYDALAEGKGEFINGSRLVYPMERQAMRFLNLLANHAFSALFTYLLNQRYTDTLCGTKALLRRDYLAIAANRDYFGDFDPFGDFDLIFGASKLNLKTAEIPIRYAAREYGETQISRFRHGWLLLRMVVFAFRKLKAL